VYLWLAHNAIVLQKIPAVTAVVGHSG